MPMDQMQISLYEEINNEQTTRNRVKIQSSSLREELNINADRNSHRCGVLFVIIGSDAQSTGLRPNFWYFELI